MVTDPTTLSFYVVAPDLNVFESVKLDDLIEPGSDNVPLILAAAFWAPAIVANPFYFSDQHAMWQTEVPGMGSFCSKGVITSWQHYTSTSSVPTELNQSPFYT
jgi:hypothetical protein